MLLLVKGTQNSKLAPIGDASQSVAAQTFRVTSTQVRYLFTDAESFLDLDGYCDFK